MSDTSRTISRNAVRALTGGGAGMLRALNAARTPAGAALRARLLAKGWRAAQRPGCCAVCGGPFYPTQAIKHHPTDTPGNEYRADCCPGDDRG